MTQPGSLVAPRYREGNKGFAESLLMDPPERTSPDDHAPAALIGTLLCAASPERGQRPSHTIGR